MMAQLLASVVDCRFRVHGPPQYPTSPPLNPTNTM